jgi:nicotinamidase-related amidase
MHDALLIIDPLWEFVHGGIRGEDHEAILLALQHLLRAARSTRGPVVYCTDEHVPVDRELEIWGPHALKGSEGAEILPVIAPAPSDFVVPKRTYGAFFEAGLDSLLKDLGARKLDVAGFYTDPCIHHTVTDAFFERYRVVVVADAVAALLPGNREDDLAYMRRMYGAELEVTSDLIRMTTAGC